MSSAKIPSVKIPSGANVPAVGLGTWKSKPGEVKQAVKDAIDLGYRHFDCALIYGNENEVGEAFAEKFKEGVVKREDLFVCSKVWNTYHSKKRVHQGISETLAALKLDYVDLYIIHWPFGFVEDQGLFPLDKEGKTIGSDVDYVETWQALEEVQKAGKAKYIGVSNFNVEQLKRVKEVAKVPVSVNQIEVHVYLQNKEVIDYCTKNGIAVVAYSPLGSMDRPKTNTGDIPPPLEDETVKKIAAKHKKQPGHVLLRFLLQRDMIVIPKSVHKERMKANLELFDFQLDKDDMDQLDKLDHHGELRTGIMESSWDNLHHPFPYQGKKVSGK